MTEQVARRANTSPVQRWLLRGSEFLMCSVAHFALALGSAFIGFGLDLDQLRSRSWLSRVFATVNEVLMYPHDAALRTVPNAWLIHNLWVIPVALVVHSLMWGALSYALLLVWRARRSSD